MASVSLSFYVFLCRYRRHADSLFFAEQRCLRVRLLGATTARFCAEFAMPERLAMRYY